MLHKTRVSLARLWLKSKRHSTRYLTGTLFVVTACLILSWVLIPVLTGQTTTLLEFLGTAIIVSPPAVALAIICGAFVGAYTVPDETVEAYEQEHAEELAETPFYSNGGKKT